jgi:hypothetical protein
MKQQQQRRHSSSKSVPLSTTLQASVSTGSSVSQNSSAMHFFGCDSHLQSSKANFFDENTFLRNHDGYMFSWSDIFTMGVVLLGFACLSIFLGVAAGISISIHYFETDSSLNLHVLSQPSSYNIQSKVTTLDPIIANMNSLRGTPDSLNRVIHTSATGQKSVLMVVEETSIYDVSNNRSFKDTADMEWNDYLERNFASPPPPPQMLYENYATVHPVLCSDGRTLGFQSTNHLHAALEDVNHYSAERQRRWQDYFDALVNFNLMSIAHDRPPLSETIFHNSRMYYEEEIVFTVCPHQYLGGGSGDAFFVNTEGLTIECEGCTIGLHYSHFEFGAFARNVHVRGITFEYATRGSLKFPEDGSEVDFDNCSWIHNRSNNPSWGAIVDIYSNSVANFYRCMVSKPLGPQGDHVSSLSIRNK